MSPLTEDAAVTLSPAQAAGLARVIDLQARWENLQDNPGRPISDYTSPEVSTVAEQTPLPEVIDALILSPLKRVVVIDTEGHVKGIISDVDVLSQMQEEVRPGLLGTLASWARSKPGRLPTATLQTSHGKARIAADLMNRDVVTVTEMTSVQATIERMMTTRRKVLPVVDAQGHLVGIVGRSDLLRVLLEGGGGK